MSKLKDIFDEFNNHLMMDTKPSDYFNSISKDESLWRLYPLKMLSDLIDTPQASKHHPEGSVWNHTMLVVNQAASRRDESENPQVLMWTALLHDIGKAPTTKLRKGRLTSYDHDKVGKELSIKFLKEFNCNDEFIKKVSSLVRWHMQSLFVIKELPFAEIKAMLNDVNLKEIALFCLCDRLGRGEMSPEKEEEVKWDIDKFVKKCEQYIPVGTH